MIAYNSLGEAEARIAIDACLAALRLRGQFATIAVSDAHGELVGLWRMDGAPLPSAPIAENKAYTAARVAGPSGDLGRAAQAGGWDVHFHGNGRYVGWDGGVAVMHRGKCIGGIAVSGLSGAEDLEIATIGQAAVAELLECDPTD